MSVIVEYGECPLCWKESKTATTVGFDPEVGIACAAGHKFADNPDFHAPKTEVALEPTDSPNPPRLEAEAAPAEESVQLSDEAAASAPDPVAPLGGAVFTRSAVQAGEDLRVPNRDLLFGLVIPETLADNLVAYAEEQKKPLSDILNGLVINILEQEWWK